jgi:hypothetical protein
MKKNEKLKELASINQNAIKTGQQIQLPQLNTILQALFITDPISVINPVPTEVQNGGKTFYYVLDHKESTGGGCDTNFFYNRFTDGDEAAGCFSYCKD